MFRHKLSKILGTVLAALSLVLGLTGVAHADWTARLANGENGLCATAGPSSWGYLLFQATCDATRTDQQWRFRLVSGPNTYQLVNGRDEQCMNVDRAVTTDRASVVTAPCNSLTKSQLWRREIVFDKIYYSPQHAVSKCLGHKLDGGSWITQNDCLPDAFNQWSEQAA
jgi:hypothetical protein